MSRARSLKPGFFKNEDLADLDPLTRIFFQGLWCEADRRGILEDRPKRLKASILPYDPIDPDKCLNDLERAGFIKRYEEAGTRCILVVNFVKHQTPHKDERASNLPTPGEHSVDPVETPEEPGAKTPITYNPEPITLNPEPSTPPTPSKGDEEPTDNDDDEPAGFYTADFEQFWAAYPRKKKKGYAFRCWQKAKGRPLLPVLLDAIARQKQSHDWLKDNGDYIPHPSTWLNGRSWDDEVEIPPDPYEAWKNGNAAVAPELLGRRSL